MAADGRVARRDVHRLMKILVRWWEVVSYGVAGVVAIVVSAVVVCDVAACVSVVGSFVGAVVAVAAWCV